MQYPFTTNLNTGYTEYYSPSLEDPRESIPPMYTTRTQEPFYQSNVVPFSVGVGALFASGFIPAGNNQRLWDFYVRGIRAVEEYSPASILRTFQLSPIFSQFTTPSVIELTSKQLQDNRAYAQYLTKLIGGPDDGATYAKLVGEGVRLEKGQLFFGGGGLALERASVIDAPAKAGMQFGRGYATSVGRTLRKSDIPVEDDLMKLIIGGQNRFQSFGRQAAGLGTAYVGRFNELLQSPFELEPFRTVFGKIKPVLQKIPLFKEGFAVKPGTGLEMLGRFALKYGAGLGAIYMGYQTLDHLMRKSELLDDTLFEEGLTAGVATLGIQANLTLSRAAEMTGLQSYREMQEDVAPGSTSLQKLLALPLVGGFGALTSGYVSKVYKMAQAQIQDPKLTAAGARKLIEEAAQEFGGDDWYSRVGRAITQESGDLYNRQDMLGTIMRKIATPEGGSLRFKFIGKVGPVKLMGLAGLAAGAALTLPFLPGALVPDTRPEELERIYSGEEEVAIRKGRFWEFGRTPYEGGRIMYYRPHWYPRMLMRAKEKAIYGDEELSPLEKFWKREMTYELEQEHYEDRPYPITALPFEDVPLVGPLLAATIGRMIKPERLMHTDEWLTDQGAAVQPPRFGGRIATEIGEQPHALPTSPFTLDQVVGEQAYRMTEMIGLPGFVMTSIKEKLTGTPELFDQVRQLESARRMAGYEREYWDLELGGMLGMNEAFRRLYPHRRRQIPLYNPIRNTMPEWLPGAGERSPDFLHGDPYCVTSDTFIELTEGHFKRAKDVVVGDVIKTHKGNEQPVKAVAKRDVTGDEKIYEIKVSSLAAFPLQASEEHPIWTPDGWRPIKDLQVGDYVGYPMPIIGSLVYHDLVFDLAPYTALPYTKDHIYVQSSQEYADCVWYIENVKNKFARGELKQLLKEKNWNRKTFENAQRGVRYNNINRIPRYINSASKEFGIISGYWLSEGSSSNGSLCFAFHKNETEYHNELLDAFKVLFDVNGNVYTSHSGDGSNVIITNKALAQILPNLWGKYFNHKHLGYQNWKSVKETLRCLFNGDGSFFFDKGKPRLSLKLKNLKLLYQVRLQLLEFGYVGYITEDNLILRGQSAKECAKFLGCKYQECNDSSRTVRHTYVKDGYLWMRIFDKQEIPQQEVYGFEIDVDDSFCVVGIATHNTKVQEGELRLPGRGYEARYPELRGTAPKDYPLIHQYKILGDVAPYSGRFKEVQGRVRGMRKSDSWNEYDENIFQMVEEQKEARRARKEFNEYEYLSPIGRLGDSQKYATEDSTSLIAALNEMNAERQEEKGLWARLYGGYWEALSHNAETALDQLTPVAPGAKLMHQRTAIEDYERTQLFGSENAFWSKPWRDFIRPFFKSTVASFGFTDVPEHLENKRDIEQYFDILQYTKYARLANVARSERDREAVAEFESKKDETLFGVNPFTLHYTSLYRSLPRSERDYFSAFEQASSPEERAKILDMVPDNEKGLYVARWKLAMADDIKKAKETEILTEEQEEEADKVLDNIYDEASREGFPRSKDLLAEYIQTRLDGESYADWYRRVKLLSKVALPGPDWVGWHPSVDLNDIKLKFVQELGEDMHEYNLWASQAQSLIDKPYINKETIKELVQPEEISDNELASNVNQLFLVNRSHPNVFFQKAWNMNQNEMTIDIEQEADMEDILKEIL